MPARFLSSADRALIVEFGSHIDPAVSLKVLRLDAALRSERLSGVVETVPTFRSLMVYFDPLTISRADLEPVIRSLLDRPGGGRPDARRWRVPVCYERQFAPDLDEVAGLTGLAPTDVAALHHAPCYHVYMLGFLPGFPYLGDLPDRLRLPRRAEPRLRVPAGSISIATSLTAIYPYESPGGWHLIGATPLRLFDASRSPPALLTAGDAVQFEPIDADTFAALHRAAETGGGQIDSEPFVACRPG